jgi:AcrR family transcriptional regulator
MRESAPRPVRRKRRTQQERSAETRALLVDVTIECLAELGYAGTTAHEIAERAGLSRGAQLHHFGAKSELLVATMQHLFELRLAEFRRGMRELAPGEEPASAAIRLLWRILSGSTGHAYLELALAARTDPELGEKMRELTARLDAEVENIFLELFESTPESAGSFDLAWTAVFALLEGLAVETIVRPGEARIERTVDLLASVAPLVMKARGP